MATKTDFGKKKFIKIIRTIDGMKRLISKVCILLLEEDVASAQTAKTSRI